MLYKVKNVNVEAVPKFKMHSKAAYLPAVHQKIMELRPNWCSVKAGFACQSYQNG